MFRTPMLGAVALLLAAWSTAAPACERAEVGIEGQLYPTGVVGAVRVHLWLDERQVLTLRAGYDRADRDDAGEHDDEEGGGPGISLGYRRYRSANGPGWFYGGRVDAWWLDIDWKDDPGLPAARSGSTEVLVVQPTVEAGYRFRLRGSERWAIEPSLALGFEINASTDGEEVGEGAILLGGLALSYRF